MLYWANVSVSDGTEIGRQGLEALIALHRQSKEDLKMDWFGSEAEAARNQIKWLGNLVNDVKRKLG